MKKLLSILGAMGLVATASTGVVSCTSAFASGSLSVEITGDNQKDFGDNFATPLDKMVNKANGYWAYNNKLAAKLSKIDASKTKDWDEIAEQAVASVYKVDGKFYVSLVQKFNEYSSKLNDDVKTSRMGVTVQMVSLGSLIKQTGDKLDADLKDVLKNKTDKDITFNLNAELWGKLTPEMLEKAAQAPKAGNLSGVKAEITFHKQAKENK